MSLTARKIKSPLDKSPALFPTSPSIPALPTVTIAQRLQTMRHLDHIAAFTKRES
jgi:hypothetical protein